jgi:hypothetical protein
MHLLSAFRSQRRQLVLGNALVSGGGSLFTDWPETGLWEVKGMFPVRLGIVGQLCVPFVCRSSSGSTGDSDRTSRLTVGQSEGSVLYRLRECFHHSDASEPCSPKLASPSSDKSLTLIVVSNREHKRPLPCRDIGLSQVEICNRLGWVRKGSKFSAFMRQVLYRSPPN